MYNTGETREVKIADITPSTRRFSVTFKVLNVNDEKQITSRRDGSEHRVADVLVGDETGVAVLTAWDNEIDQFKSMVGDTVTLNNGYVSLFQGKLRLGLGRFGSIKPSEEKIEQVNSENNISEKEFEDTGFRGGRRGGRRRF
ncbi:MAG: single-stranded DNA-binding protein [Infirmifilum sp.]